MITSFKPYSVAFWGSEPMTNDDCWTAGNYATIEEAQKDFEMVTALLEAGETVWGCSVGHDGCEVAYVVIDGPDVHQERRLSEPEPTQERDDLWENEFAMQNGMAFGCDGYNDVRGW
jgi:hypothetical protein